MDGGGDFGGRIGPNALLQLAPVLEAAGRPALVRAIFAEGGLTGLPEAQGMIPEGPVAAIHRAVRRRGDAAALLAEAGWRTADYISWPTASRARRKGP
jgi:divinyl protochlorophyllide a 8-vinyl-reductase